MVVGITGGIGSGKSVVSRLLRCNGYEVYDCDFEARRLMDGSAKLKRDMADNLGVECIVSDGSIDRPAVARIVFADKDKLLWLNSQVHSMVRDDILSRIKDAEANSAHTDSDHIFFIESAILNTGGITPFCNQVWLVEAPMIVRVNRVVGRDGFLSSDVEARINAQCAEFDDFGGNPVKVIRNDDSDSLILQIETLINSIC